MGAALSVAAILFALMNLDQLPSGGAALELTGAKLAVAVAINFVLGALMTLGIGLYAPCLILVSLLGMILIAAFPIMMGSCAVLMPVAALRFISDRKYDLRAALGLTLCGIPAVLLAAYVVRFAAAHLAALAGGDHCFVRCGADAALGARKTGRQHEFRRAGSDCRFFAAIESGARVVREDSTEAQT